MILASAFLNQLQQNRLELKPIYLLYGEEALFLRDCADGLRHALQAQGYLYGERYEVDAGFDWRSLQMETQAGSLFSEQRVVSVSMPKGNPGTDGTQFIQDWVRISAELPQPPEVIVVIECEKLESRQLKSKWAAAIESAGLVVQAKPVPAQALPGWCQQKAQQVGIQLDNEAAALLAERVEGNLLAADQELIKLSLLFPQGSVIDASIIAQSVVDQAHYQLFALSSEML
ncbi:MAG: DNA polymerase III subunit delta, partial [Gammaproteobacteria bacterium]|nr:DNA polymerase III subunit delta [Gammaproteobacteria bacterium]